MPSAWFALTNKVPADLEDEGLLRDDVAIASSLTRSNCPPVIVSVPPTRVSVIAFFGRANVYDLLDRRNGFEQRRIRRPAIAHHAAGRRHHVRVRIDRRRSRAGDREGREVQVVHQPDASGIMDLDPALRGARRCDGRGKRRRGSRNRQQPCRKQVEETHRTHRKSAVTFSPQDRSDARVKARLLLDVRLACRLAPSPAMRPHGHAPAIRIELRCRRPMPAASSRSTMSASTFRAGRSSGCSAPTAPASRP